MLYLATLPANVYWDGITFALHIDMFEATGKAGARLFHQNHLLYTPVMLQAVRMATSAGLHVDTLTILQVSSALFSAGALWMVAVVGDGLTGSRRIGTATMVLVGSFAGWWMISADASAYPLSILLLLCAVADASSDRPRLIRCGMLLAAAMLVHQLAALGLPAVVAALCVNPNRRHRARDSAAVAGLAGGASVAVYVFVAFWKARAGSLAGVVRWSLSNPSNVSVRRDPTGSFCASIRAQFEAVVAPDVYLMADLGGIVLTLALAASVVTLAGTAILLVRRARLVRVSDPQSPLGPAGNYRRLLIVSLAWIVPYSGFLLFWEAWFIPYRCFSLPAVALLAASGCEALARRTSIGFGRVLTVAVCTLLVTNFAVAIRPRMDLDSNPRIAAALHARTIWDVRTAVVASDLTEVDTTFRYFNPAVTWVVADRVAARNRTSVVAAAVHRLQAEGFDVWLSDGAATRLGIETPDIGRTITWLEARTGLQQIRYVRLDPPAPLTAPDSTLENPGVVDYPVSVKRRPVDSHQPAGIPIGSLAGGIEPNPRRVPAHLGV